MEQSVKEPLLNVTEALRNRYAVLLNITEALRKHYGVLRSITEYYGAL